MSQVWRRSEVGNHKRRSLNTRLSSGTSANTSCRSRNAPGRMIRWDLFWYRNNLKMKPRTFCIICLDGSGQPLTKRSVFIFAIMASARTFRGCLFDGRTRRSVILDFVVLYKCNQKRFIESLPQEGKKKNQNMHRRVSAIMYLRLSSRMSLIPGYYFITPRARAGTCSRTGRCCRRQCACSQHAHALRSCPRTC